MCWRNRQEEFKDLITLSMMEYFGGDQEPIEHALKVLGFAEKILEQENGNTKAAVAAAILYDIVVHKAETRWEIAKRSSKEEDRLKIVRGILERVAIKEGLIEEVCQMLEAHPEKIDTLNSKTVYDAVRLVDSRDQYDIEDKEGLKKIIKRAFLTPTGKKMARYIIMALAIHTNHLCLQ